MSLFSTSSFARRFPAQICQPASMFQAEPPEVRRTFREKKKASSFVLGQQRINPESGSCALLSFFVYGLCSQHRHAFSLLVALSDS